MANQKETSQPESWAIAFVFMLFSQAFEDRHFTNVKFLLYVLSGKAIRIDAERVKKCAITAGVWRSPGPCLLNYLNR
jgi:hypothetical protein